MAAIAVPASAGPPSGYGDTDGGEGGFGGASNDAGFGHAANETNSSTTEHNNSKYNETNSSPTQPNNNFDDSDNDDEPQTVTKSAPTAPPEPVAATQEAFHSYDEAGIDVPFEDLDLSEEATAPVPAAQKSSMFSGFTDFVSSFFEPAAPEVVDAPDSSYDEVGINFYYGDVINGTELDDTITVNDGKHNREVVIATDGVEQSYFMARQQGEGVTVNGRGGNDTIFGTAFNDRLNGGTGDDHIYGFGGDDAISGGAGDDVVYGGHGEDALNGDDGNDYLSGGTDDDTLEGGSGRDILSGGHGDDELDGGLDGDVVVGGPGTDRIANSGSGDGDVIYASSDDVISRSEKAEVVEFEPVALENLKLDAPGPDEASVLSSDLTTLGSIPSGGELIRSLNGTGRPVTVIHVPESKTMVPGAYRPNDDVMLRPDGSPGPGSDPAVWNTFMTNKLVGTNLSVITLGHELIHAKHIAKGTEDPGFSVELDENGDALVDPVTGDVVFSFDSELQVIGLPYDQDGNKTASETDPQTPSPAGELDENLQNVTENAIRADLALPPRENYNTSVDPRFEEAGLIHHYAKPLAPNTPSADPEIDRESVPTVTSAPTVRSVEVNEPRPTSQSNPPEKVLSISESAPAISFTTKNRLFFRLLANQNDKATRYEPNPSSLSATSTIGQSDDTGRCCGFNTCRPVRPYWGFPD